jgi:hypothetical protein
MAPKSENPEQEEKNNDRNWYPDEPKQSTFEHVEPPVWPLATGQILVWFHCRSMLHFKTRLRQEQA